MKKSLSLKLSSIFSAIVLVTCVILVSTCGVICTGQAFLQHFVR